MVTTSFFVSVRLFLLYANRWIAHDEAHVYPATASIWKEKNKDKINDKPFHARLICYTRHKFILQQSVNNARFLSE